MIYVIKLDNGEIIIGEGISDEPEHITISDPIKIFQTPVQLKDNTFYTSLIPILYFPFGFSNRLRLQKSKILTYDLADNYYVLFYNSSVTDLLNAEKVKQEYVTKLYSGESESSLQWDNEDHGEPIVPEGLQEASIEEIEKSLDEMENLLYNTEPSKTLH